MLQMAVAYGQPRPYQSPVLTQPRPIPAKPYPQTYAAQAYAGPPGYSSHGYASAGSPGYSYSNPGAYKPGTYYNQGFGRY